MEITGTMRTSACMCTRRTPYRVCAEPGIAPWSKDGDLTARTQSERVTRTSPASAPARFVRLLWARFAVIADAEVANCPQVLLFGQRVTGRVGDVAAHGVAGFMGRVHPQKLGRQRRAEP